MLTGIGPATDVAQAAEPGARLERALRAVDVPGVRAEPIGRGMMVGARVADAPADDAAGSTRSVVRRMREVGVIALRGGNDGSVVNWTPPLTITTGELDHSVEILTAPLLVAASSAGDLR